MIMDVVGAVFLVVWIVYLVLRSRFSTLPNVSRSGFLESPANVLIMYFPGIAWNPRMQIEEVSPLFKRRGTVSFVYYSGTAGPKARFFSLKDVVRVAASHAYDWKNAHPNGTIVLVGASMGADLAYRTDMLLHKHGISTGAVLIDPPRGWKDLALPQRILTILGWAVYNLPVLHLLLLVQPAIRLFVPKLNYSQVEEKMRVPRRLKRLQKAVMTARQTKVSFYVGESLSLLSRLPKGSSSWTGRNVAVIHSERDNTVDAFAYQSWERRIGQQIPCFIARGAYHAGFGLTPSAYSASIEAAMDWVLQDAG